MKISMLSVFYPFRGGIAQFSTSLQNALSEKNKVQILNFKRQYPSVLFPGKSQYVDEFVSKDENQLVDSINPLSALKVARRANAFQPELFLSNYWMSFFGPIMGLVAKKVQTSAVKIALIHNIIPHERRFFDGFANRYFLKQHDGFIVLSEAVKKDLHPLVGNKPITVIKHPTYTHFGSKIDKAEARRKLGVQQDKKVLLFFGLIRDYKGLDLLLHAMRELSDDFLLLIVGECYGSFAAYQEIIDDFNLQPKVSCTLEFIADGDVAPYFSASDLCILPYKHATQSGVLAVSAHFDLPCLVTHVGGLKEHVLHNETGFVVEEPTVELLVEGIKFSFSEMRIGEWSQALATGNEVNSWSNFADKLIDFTHEVIDYKLKKANN
jgi:glycosyltransferase involved in cell wall biosynthesis